MTPSLHDYDLLTEAIASVALLCAETIGLDEAVRTTVQLRGGNSRPVCFRPFRHPSAQSMGVCPGRKQGPEEKSHAPLNSAVFPARNVS